MVFATIRLQIQSKTFEWLHDKILFKPVPRFQNSLDYQYFLLQCTDVHLKLTIHHKIPFVAFERFVSDHVWCLNILRASPKASSAFICFNNFLKSFFMYASKVSQANKRFLKENIPKTCLRNFKTSSSFIQPFEDDAKTHRFLNSLFSTAASRLAPWKTIRGFNFVPSAFAV